MATSTSLLERLKKASKIDGAEVMAESKLFGTKEFTRTEVPMINVALSGAIDGGLTSGLTVLAGPSKHFKTSFGLLMVGAYLKENPDAVCMFYDSEFGSPQSYFTSFGIDPARVLHTPITNIEELKFDLVSQLNGINRGDKIIIMIDSIGNLASKKEVEDAINEKSVADMTRAKAFKGLFRMVTPMLTLKDIPLLAVNHTYMTQEMYSKAVVSGGCLVPGTMIQTLSGLKPIEDIKRGDIVHTLDGEKMVTDAWTPETLEFGEPECYEVSFEDGTSVTCSGQHPFLTDSGWIDAEDLSIGIEVKKL
jgi:hypothetical protein